AHARRLCAEAAVHRLQYGAGRSRAVAAGAGETARGAASQRYAALAATAGAATRPGDGAALFRKQLVFLRQAAVGARVHGDPARPGVLRLSEPHEDAGLLERERLAAAVQARRRRRALRVIPMSFVPASAAGREVG